MKVLLLILLIAFLATSQAFQMRSRDDDSVAEDIDDIDDWVSS